jgi:hypothetical protein
MASLVYSIVALLRPCLHPADDASSFSTANTEKIIRVDKGKLCTQFHRIQAFVCGVGGCGRGNEVTHTVPGQIEASTQFLNSLQSLWRCVALHAELEEGERARAESEYAFLMKTNTKNTWSAWTIAT